MDKLTTWLTDKLMPIALKFGNNRYVKALSNALIITIPLTIVGGISMILASPPVDPKLMHGTNFLMKMLLGWYHWAVKYNQQIMTPYNLTMGAIALFVAFAVAYYLAQEYHAKWMDLDPLSSGVISACSFLVIAVVWDKEGGLMLTYIGAQGFFTAMIVGVATVELSRLLLKYDIRIKMPAGVPPAVAASFNSLFSMIFNVFLFHILNLLSGKFFGASIPAAIMKALTPVLKGTDTVWFFVIMMIICQLLWLIGIHGGAIIGTVTSAVYTNNLVANATAKMAGKAMPYIVTGPLSVYVVVMGGAGATLGLMFLMLWSKSKQLKAVARVALIPGLFGINEPLLFGTPLILNPVLAIPFVLMPIINAFLGYYATAFGLVGRAYINAPWTMPPFLGLPLSTMDWRAFILVCVVFVIDMVLYYPFLKAYEKTLIVQEEAAAKNESIQAAEAETK